jgi:alkylhydroperoxidase/carboxymuconolactone decarboxylase family protein YurZ
MDRMTVGRKAIGTIMGRSGEDAHAILTDWYGDAIADEVINIGALWERPVLTKRERSLAVIAALTALGTLDRLRLHVGGALNHGATPEEIEEVILMMMVYAGHPRAPEAVEVARAVIRERG